MNCPFEVGQMVVCVQVPWAFSFNTENCNIPNAGQILTIRGILPNAEFIRCDGIPYGDIGLLFEEIRNIAQPGYAELMFLWRCFRPVKPTSIELFRKLLVPIPGKLEREPLGA